MSFRHNASDVHLYYIEQENKYTTFDLLQWYADHQTYPFIAVGIYLLVIAQGETLMNNRKPISVRPLLLLWNLSLAIFSMINASRGIAYVLHDAYVKNFTLDRMVCDAVNDTDNVSSFWVYLFTMSKFVELGDTIFLLIRKRPVLFLHWYHHVTVLLFTWTASSSNAPMGKYFLTMNVIVHSVMYTYYALQTLGVRIPKKISITITCMQISQMIFGIAILVTALLISYRRQCHNHPVIMVTGAIIYGSYLFLFIQFFIDAYMKGAKQNKKKV